MKYFDTTNQDWFNYVSQSGMSNGLIQFILKTAGKIDYALLKKSVYLSFYAEPVLGCRFMEKNQLPLWKTIDDIDKFEVCKLIITDNVQRAVDNFLAEIIFSPEVPQVKTCLIRGKHADTICIKINHSACDGSGAKYYLNLLTKIYTELKKDEDYIPEQRIYDRSTKRLYEALEIDNKERFFQPEVVNLTSTWSFPAENISDQSDVFVYDNRRLAGGELRNLYYYSRKYNVTINNIILAAYFISLLEFIDTDDKFKEIQFMVDLRRYLPEVSRDMINNFSAIVNVNLPVNTNKGFLEMLKNTNSAMKDLMSRKPDIHGAIGSDLMMEEGFNIVKNFINEDWNSIKKTGKCTPMISNLGILSSKLLYFGNIAIDDIYLITPAFHSPAFMLGIGTYNDCLTLSASYYKGGISEEKVKLLLDSVITILKSLKSD